MKEIGWVRLLDEGTVLYGDGSIRSYIKRGTIKEFYDSLEDDYIGYINIDTLILLRYQYLLVSGLK